MIKLYKLVRLIYDLRGDVLAQEMVQYLTLRPSDVEEIEKKLPSDLILLEVE